MAQATEPSAPRSRADWIRDLSEAQRLLVKSIDVTSEKRYRLFAEALSKGEDREEELKEYDHQLSEYQWRLELFERQITGFEHVRQHELRQNGASIVPTPLLPARSLSYVQTCPASALAPVDRESASGPSQPADWISILSFRQQCAKTMDEISAERRRFLAGVLTRGEYRPEELTKYDHELAEYQKRLNKFDHQIVSSEHRRRREAGAGSSAASPIFLLLPFPPSQHDKKEPCSALALAPVRGERVSTAEEVEDTAAPADAMELASELKALLSDGFHGSLRRRARAPG